MAERLGQSLMPWQRRVAAVGGELVEDPGSGLLVPAYRDVIVLVPRQSGKTTLVLAWNLQRALGWGRPQRIVYSAQTGNDARKKLIEDQAPILEPRKAKLGIRRILRGMGNEGVEFRNGSRIGLMGSTEESGHGKTVHLADKDELFADIDDRRDQALIPAMATVADAQSLTTSTMGTDRSLPLNRAVQRGRQLVQAGAREGTAYFEWSADPDTDDPDDPDVWWRAMPALGHTINEETVRHARATLTDGEFWRAFLNVATTSDERVIPAATWDLVCRPDASPSGDLTFGVDVNPDRSAAAIVAVSDGVVEVIEHRSGLAWVVDRAAELDAKWSGPVWAVDGRSSSPIASLVPGLRDSGLTVVEVAAGDLSAACGAFFDMIVDRRVEVRRHASLDAAVEGVDKRFVGDGWVWDRRHSAADISPLYAATVALWVHEPNYDVLDSVR